MYHVKGRSRATETCLKVVNIAVNKHYCAERDACVWVVILSDKYHLSLCRQLNRLHVH